MKEKIKVHHLRSETNGNMAYVSREDFFKVNWDKIQRVLNTKGGKISVMIDTDLYRLIKEKICDPKDDMTSEQINETINNFLWDYFEPPKH